MAMTLLRLGKVKDTVVKVFFSTVLPSVYICVGTYHCF